MIPVRESSDAFSAVFQEVKRHELVKNVFVEEPELFTPMTRAAAREGRKKLSKTSTIEWGVGESQRDSLINQVTGDKRMKPTSLDDGQTGTVFALEVAGEKVAVFKPEAGEKFQRGGLAAGRGANLLHLIYPPPT